MALITRTIGVFSARERVRERGSAPAVAECRSTGRAFVSQSGAYRLRHLLRVEVNSARG